MFVLSIRKRDLHFERILIRTFGWKMSEISKKLNFYMRSYWNRWGYRIRISQTSFYKASSLDRVFFFNDIDVRRRYTRKVHPLKAWVGLSIVKIRRKGDFMGWVGVESVCGWMDGFSSLYQIVLKKKKTNYKNLQRAY